MSDSFLIAASSARTKVTRGYMAPAYRSTLPHAKKMADLMQQASERSDAGDWRDARRDHVRHIETLAKDWASKSRACTHAAGFCSEGDGGVDH
jgi:hypothetical protein